MKYYYRILSVLLILLVLFLTLVSAELSLVENKNFLNPYIDTKFATHYSPKKFERVKIGQNKSEILEILGTPLFSNDEGCEYIYTCDGFVLEKGKGSFLVNDYAWYLSTVIFDNNGVVIDIEKGWIND